MRKLVSLYVLFMVISCQPAAALAANIYTVLYFESNTGDAELATLGKGIADMLTTDFAKSGLDVVERSKLEQVMSELKLQHSGMVDAKSVQSLGRLIGASHAVTGAITIVSASMSIDAKVVEIKTSRIVTAERVLGKKDDFFTLYQKLIETFVNGLDKSVSASVKAKLKKTGKDAAPVSLAAVSKYSKGIDLADKGNYKDASKLIGEVVSEEPGFSLAKERYAEIIKKLYAAKEKRQEVLSDSETRLFQKMRSVLSEGKLDKRHFGYRILMGNYYLAKIKKTADSGSGNIDNQSINQATRHIKSFYESERVLMDEIKKAKVNFITPIIDKDDEKSAKELGLCQISSLNTISYYVAKDVGEFLIMGRYPVMCMTDSSILNPTPAELEPAYAKIGFALFDEALKDLNDSNWMHKERDSVRVLYAHGEGLLKMGEKEAAVAKWQYILDTYPKVTEFRKIENKIKKTLGISGND